MCKVWGIYIEERIHMNTIELIDRLEQDKSLQKEEWIHVIEDDSEENRKYAAEKARALGDTYYGKEIFKMVSKNRLWFR